MTDLRPSMERIHHILNKFENQKILVVGDIGVDLYTIGEVKRISPEAPVPVLEVQRREQKLGLAANVANNLKALGAEPVLVGVVGDDYWGLEFRRILKEQGISDEYLVTDPQRPTTLKERVTTAQQQLVRVDHESAQVICAQTEAAITKVLEKVIPQINAITVECYGKGVFLGDLAPKLIDLAHTHKKWIGLDPNPKSHLSKFKGVTLTTPNTHEAEVLSGFSIKSEPDFAKAAEKLRSVLDAKTVIITRGKEGLSIFPTGEPSITVPTFARRVFDVSGAGDTLIACLTLGIASGATLVEAALLANHASAVEVSKVGTATVTREEILADMLHGAT